ncbi:MAG TPA: hypothetical protein ENH82_04170 [bacterium]|nr:hypothetical protein [bacterium]
MTESIQQIQLISWWKLQYPGKIIFSIPNGSWLYGDRVTRAKIMRKMKAEGLLKGVSDLFIPIPKDEYSGLFIEMKNICKTSCSVSGDQVWFLDQMRVAGYRAEWCAGFDKAREIITEYMKGR